VWSRHVYVFESSAAIWSSSRTLDSQSCKVSSWIIRECSVYRRTRGRTGVSAMLLRSWKHNIYPAREKVARARKLAARRKQFDFFVITRASAIKEKSQRENPSGCSNETPFVLVPLHPAGNFVLVDARHRNNIKHDGFVAMYDHWNDELDGPSLDSQGSRGPSRASRDCQRERKRERERVLIAINVPYRSLRYSISVDKLLRLASQRQLPGSSCRFSVNTQDRLISQERRR